MKTISVRISETEHRQLKESAKEKGVTVSDYIRNMLSKEREEKQNLLRIDERLKKAHLSQQLANSLYCRIAIENLINDQKLKEKVDQDFAAIKTHFGL